MTKQRTLLITGASSGIGRALALLYAAPETRLLLAGRHPERLAEVAALCRARGAAVETAALCVTARAELEKQLLDWDDRFPIDLVIANAGISGGGGFGTEHSERQFRAILAVNLDGTFNTVNPLLPRLLARRQGHIALMSSMAGFRGLPGAPAYSLSKVAVRAYGDALRPLLKKQGIAVSTIFPGFVRTPLTDVNAFPMPFLMEVDRAAAIIKRGLDAEKSTIAFPWQMRLVMTALLALPLWLSDWLVSRAPYKH